MENNELIQNRSLGDKFNELSSFMIDNFKQLLKWSSWTVLPCALLMSLVMQLLPKGDEMASFLKTFFFIAINAMLAMLLSMALKPHFVEGKELKDIRIADLAREAVPKIGMGIAILISPCVLLALLSSIFVNVMQEDVTKEWFFLIVMLFFGVVLLALLYVPIYMICNVLTYESLKGFSLFNRALRLSRYRVLKTICFIIALSIIGFTLPSALSAMVELFIGFNGIIGSYLHIDAEEGTLATTMQNFFSDAFLAYFYIAQFMVIGIAMSFEYGNAVEIVDNVSFMRKYENFENL